MSIGGCLTNASAKQARFFTFILILALLTHVAHPCRSDPLPPQVSVENQNTVHLAQTYLRQQALRGASILPGSVRATIGWLSNGWHSVAAGDAENADEGGDAQTQNLTQPTDSGIAMPMQFASSYHHKGFLPTHDAMMMGVAFNQNIIDKKLQFTARPFYGQSWNSLHHYMGGEVTMKIDQRPDGLPWGALSAGYIGGNDSMIDHGSGVDLHGDVDLTNDWKFTSGVRQNSVDGNSNYVMLRWQISFGNP